MDCKKARDFKGFSIRYSKNAASAPSTSFCGHDGISQLTMARKSAASNRFMNSNPALDKGRGRISVSVLQAGQTTPPSAGENPPGGSPGDSPQRAHTASSGV